MIKVIEMLADFSRTYWASSEHRLVLLREAPPSSAKHLQLVSSIAILCEAPPSTPSPPSYAKHPIYIIRTIVCEAPSGAKGLHRIEYIESALI